MRSYSSYITVYQDDYLSKASEKLGYPKSVLLRAALDEFFRLLHLKFPQDFEMPPSLKGVKAPKGFKG